MGQIYEPVKWHRVTLTYFIGSKEYSEGFEDLAQLKAFFHRFPPLAEKLGYIENKNRKPTDGWRERAANVTLTFEYTDQVMTKVRNTFDNVHAFVKFLEGHPALGACVRYVGPVRECKILLRYTYRNHRNDLTNNEEEFISMHNFDNYLRWQPERAMAIGQLNADDETIKNCRSQNVKLSLSVNGQEITFGNYEQFIKYLTDHPRIAKRLQYR
jgi:hypothetical protein